MRVVNFYAGPGTGKSTATAALFAELKYRGHDVEMVREFAKDLVWQRRQKDMRTLGFILGEQSYRLATIAPQVEVAITDSPILLTRVYDANDAMKQLSLDIYRTYDNLDIFLERAKAYNPNGRNETEDEARARDVDIRFMLDALQIPYHVMRADRTVVNKTIMLLTEKGWIK